MTLSTLYSIDLVACQAPKRQVTVYRPPREDRQYNHVLSQV